MHDNLRDYGESFQLKIISSILAYNTSDILDTYVLKIINFINEDLFDSDVNKWIIKVIKDYYNKYNKIPTIEIFKFEISKIDDDANKQAIIENIKKCLTYIKSPDLDYVKNEFSLFCEHQALKNAILKSVDLLNQGNYNEIINIIDEARKLGVENNTIYSYENNIEERYSTHARKNLLPFQWDVINSITNGGLGAGDLGIIVGAPGRGKSWILSNIGLHALKLGKNVLHVTLELNEHYTSRRYDSILTGIQSDDLKYHLDDIKIKTMTELSGKLRIQYYPSNTVSVTQLKTLYHSLAMVNFKPDVIIIDYADNFVSDDVANKNSNTYNALGKIYEVLRGYAGEFQVPIWTASQVNRSSAENDILTGDNMADSFKKTMIPDFILSFSRKIEDTFSETARFHVIKNRYGIDQITFPAKMNTKIGRIEIFEPTSTHATNIRNEMEKGKDIIKSNMKQKLYDMKQNKNKKGFE